MTKKLLRNSVDPMTMVNFSFIIGFLSFLPVAIITSKSEIEQLISMPISFHAGVWYMAIVSGTLAFYLSSKAQKSIEIGEASVFSYLNPIFTFPLAVLWLGEKITPTVIVGGVIIAIGVLIPEIKKNYFVKLKRPKQGSHRGYI